MALGLLLRLQVDRWQLYCPEDGLPEGEDVENTIFGRRDVLLNEVKLFKDKSFTIEEKDTTPCVVQLLADVETLKAKVALLEDQVAEGSTPLGLLNRHQGLGR